MKPAVDSEIIFLAELIQTLDNDAVAYVAEHRAALTAVMPGNKHYFEDLAKRWIYGTFEKAVAQRKESLLDLTATNGEKYTGKKDEALNYWLRTQYYTKIGDQQKSLSAGIAEANFLSGKSDAYFTKEDANELEQAKSAIRIQLVMMKVPTEKLDELVNTNIKSQPELSHSASSQTANKLNEIAWNIYEHHGKEEALVQQAIQWSKRSLELSKGLNEWPLFADTYAHLLYVSGKKENAIKVQQEAVAKAKELKTDAGQLEDALKQMQAGTL
jgi:hypothetical protein